MLSPTFVKPELGKLGAVTFFRNITVVQMSSTSKYQHIKHLKCEHL